MFSTLRAALLMLLIVAASQQELQANEEQVRAALKGYVDAFNKHDAAAVAAVWSEGATHVDRETGERTEGRKAIQADIEASFKEQPDGKLAARIDHVRLIKPDVASVEGETDFAAPGAERVTTTFTAILVNQNGKWVIDSLEEMPEPRLASSSAALVDLEWLVGRWVDESDGTRIEANVRWTPGQAFLLRSLSVVTPEGTMEGTQIIGWDPRAQEIRSWTFHSDGSFGDGIWSRSGEEWLIKSSQTLPDGRAAAGTFVLKRVDDNTLTLGIIGHEIDGEPQPAKPAVKMVRAPEAAAPAKSATPATK